MLEITHGFSFFGGGFFFTAEVGGGCVEYRTVLGIGTVLCILILGGGCSAVCTFVMCDTAGETEYDATSSPLDRPVKRIVMVVQSAGFKKVP